MTLKAFLNVSGVNLAGFKPFFVFLLKFSVECNMIEYVYIYSKDRIHQEVPYKGKGDRGHEFEYCLYTR